MPGVWACLYLVGLPVDIGWLCLGLIPFSYIYRGGAVRFRFCEALASCIILGLWGIALLEINS